MFDILITKSALRQLNRMSKNIKQTVIKKIARVAANPHAPNNNVKPLRKGVVSQFENNPFFVAWHLLQ